MNSVQFGEATAPKTPSPIIPPQTPSLPPTGPEPIEGQPPKHFNWHWRRWILVCLAVIVLSSAVAYIAHRPKFLGQTQSPQPTPPPQITQTTPTPTSNGVEDAEGKICGGFAGNSPEYRCPVGYKCQVEEGSRDAFGKCVILEATPGR